MLFSRMPGDQQSSRPSTVGTLKEEWQAGRTVRNTGIYLAMGVALEVLRLFGMLNWWDVASDREGGIWEGSVSEVISSRWTLVGDLDWLALGHMEELSRMASPDSTWTGSDKHLYLVQAAAGKLEWGWGGTSLQGDRSESRSALESGVSVWRRAVWGQLGGGWYTRESACSRWPSKPMLEPWG